MMSTDQRLTVQTDMFIYFSEFHIQNLIIPQKIGILSLNLDIRITRINGTLRAYYFPSITHNSKSC